MTPKIEIYTTPTCGYCVRAKDFFKKHNLFFTEIDVTENRNLAKVKEVFAKVGQYGVPVIVINGEAIFGFDLVKIKKALGLK